MKGKISHSPVIIPRTPDLSDPSCRKWNPSIDTGTLTLTGWHGSLDDWDWLLGPLTFRGLNPPSPSFKAKFRATLLKGCVFSGAQDRSKQSLISTFSTSVRLLLQIQPVALHFLFYWTWIYFLSLNHTRVHLNAFPQHSTLSIPTYQDTNCGPVWELDFEVYMAESLL